MTVPADVIVLSSSPDPPQRTPQKAIYDQETCLGISPPAATPLSLLRLPSRSRFFPTPSAPDDATKKKTKKGRSKANTARLSVNDEDALAESQEKAKKVTKAPTKSGVLAELEPGSLDSRKNVAKKAVGPQKGWPHSSAKSKEQGNMTLAGKVTKSSNEPSTKDASKSGKKTSAKGKSSENQQAESTKPNVLAKDEDLHLDEAMRRRMDWTPPRETNPKDVSANEDGDDIANENDKRNENAFGKVLSNYNYTGLTSGTCDIASNAPGEGPTKRRRIELVDPQIYPLPTKRSGAKDMTSGQEDDSSSSGAQVTKKAKSQKRFKTLTARMTAQYTNDTEDDDAMDVVVPDIGKAKSRRGKEKTKDQETEFVVLSPEAAFKTLDDQNLIFGTCSQLEREDSPETLREMQQAMRESESLASCRLEPEIASIGSRHASVSRLTGARNLWGVAARDTEGSLVQGRGLDTVDLTEVTGASQANQSAKVKSSAASLEDDWFDLDYGKPAGPAEAATLSEKLSRTVVEPQAPVIAESTARVKSAQRAVKSAQPEVATVSQKNSQQSLMPRYEGFTDAELSKQVAAYGFKSVRGRKKTIELLQKCWESRHGKGSKESQTQPQPSSQSTSRPATSNPIQGDAQLAGNTTKIKTTEKSKSKQREAKSAQTELVTSVTPKKSSRKASRSDNPPPSSFIDVEEIQDSEEEVFLSPSQVQKRYTDLLSNATSSAPEPSLEFLPKATPQSPTKRKTHAAKSSRTPKTLSTKSSTTESSKRSNLPDLLSQITKAILAQPKHSSSLGSRSHLTWHEKILMYDPVILEDLTAWLNVEGLGLVGEDREIGTATVREWCEGKGICCCWKKNASW